MSRKPADGQLDLTFRSTPIPPPATSRHWHPETRAGVSAAEENANELWIQTARLVLLEIARKSREFSSADVDAGMQIWHPEITTHEKRAMGAVMVWAKKRKLIEVGRIARDPRPHCHNQFKRIWKSLVFEGDSSVRA